MLHRKKLFIVLLFSSLHVPTNIYLFKVKNSANYVQRQQEKYQNVIDVVLVFLVLTLNIFHNFFSVSIVDFEQVNASWGYVSSMWKSYFSSICYLIKMNNFKKLKTKFSVIWWILTLLGNFLPCLCPSWNSIYFDFNLHKLFIYTLVYLYFCLIYHWKDQKGYLIEFASVI